MVQWHEWERLGVFWGYKLGVSAEKERQPVCSMVRITAGLAPKGKQGTRCGQQRTVRGSYKASQKEESEGFLGIRRHTPKHQASDTTIHLTPAFSSTQ